MKTQYFALALLAAACGMPSQDQVKREFVALHTNAVVLDATVGEGDFDHASWCIRYRELPDTTLREQYWLYQRGEDNRFTVIHRDSAVARAVSCTGAA